MARTYNDGTWSLLCYEVIRQMATHTVRIETPVASTEAEVIAGKKLVSRRS